MGYCYCNRRLLLLLSSLFALLHVCGADVYYPGPAQVVCGDDLPCLVLYQNLQDRTWEDAYQLCRNQGMYLLPIYNQAIQTKVKTLLQLEGQTVDQVWTAGRQSGDGPFRFRNGDVFEGISGRSEENCAIGELHQLDETYIAFTTNNCAELQTNNFIMCQSQSEGCTDGYISGGYCYQYRGEGEDWFQDRMTCLQHGSDLIQTNISNDVGLLSFFHDKVHSYAFWIGAVRYPWVWHVSGDNVEMQYYNWDPDTDRKDKTDYCLYVDHQSAEDRWRPADCTTVLPYFMCLNVTSTEIDPPSTATTTTTTTVVATTTTTTAPSPATVTTTSPPITTLGTKSEPTTSTAMTPDSTTEHSPSETGSGDGFNLLYVIIPVVGVVVIAVVIISVILIRKRRDKQKNEADTEDLTHTYNNTIIRQPNGSSDYPNNLYTTTPESEYSSVITELHTDTSAPSEYASAITDTANAPETKPVKNKKEKKKKSKDKQGKKGVADNSGTLTHKIAPGGDVYALPMKVPGNETGGHNGSLMGNEVSHVMTEAGDIYALPIKDHGDGIRAEDIGDISF